MHYVRSPTCERLYNHRLQQSDTTFKARAQRIVELMQSRKYKMQHMLRRNVLPHMPPTGHHLRREDWCQKADAKETGSSSVTDDKFGLF